MGEKNRAPIISVKVMSFNIAHGLGMDGTVNLEKTASVIEDSCAGIVALQEVDRHFSARSSFMDQVEWLSKRLGMHAAFGATLDLEPETPDMPRPQYGNAILSKYPIKYFENHLLRQIVTPFGHNEQRGVLEAIIEIKGSYISVYNTHLALKDEELEVSISELLAITGKSRFPRIVTGDFNAAPDHEQIKKMKQGFTDVFLKMKRGDAYTYPAPYHNESTGERSKPVTRIDYIFMDSELDVAQTAVMDTAVSDHIPILADLIVMRTKKLTEPPTTSELQKA
ncbi:endonuclease/exonuclease/phosphatase family protein [Planococcus sp. N028]|uniref:Endonuclease/exonuclease/phosphatase family protein n=1 Tax=Planococcus shixiaomingii TaxID=3058393 RepID=A0ABT8N5D0_9BACL|nr:MULTISPECIES: endonuclease/exonuclease/phosphatase family protein [unclassified Planococcus (in: firmicutes)]MDN7243089.1 endonuclease/exonuclease/phosphatase family protein [Planococcus sp. N028]WKA55036.1 endonuclease/exonuclease/phosphatase family protein [Planococcus sp. N022]